MQYPTKRYQRQKGKKCPNFQDLFSLEDILLAQRVNRTHQTGLSRIVICAPDQRYDIYAPLFPNASSTTLRCLTLKLKYAMDVWTKAVLVSSDNPGELLYYWWIHWEENETSFNHLEYSNFYRDITVDELLSKFWALLKSIADSGDIKVSEGLDMQTKTSSWACDSEPKVTCEIVVDKESGREVYDTVSGKWPEKKVVYDYPFDKTQRTFKWDEIKNMFIQLTLDQLRLVQGEKMHKCHAIDKELFAACNRMDLDGVKRAIELGANVNALNDSGECPITETIQYSADHFREWNKKYTDEEYEEHKRMAFERTTPIVELLLEHGADIDLFGYDGLQPLVTAYLDGNVEMSRFLLEHGSNPNYNSYLTDITSEEEKASISSTSLFYLYDEIDDYTPEQLAIEKLLYQFGGRIFNWGYDGMFEPYSGKFTVRMELYKTSEVFRDSCNEQIGDCNSLQIEREDGLMETIDLTGISGLKEWVEQFRANYNDMSYDWMAWRDRGLIIAKEIANLLPDYVTLHYLRDSENEVFHQPYDKSCMYYSSHDPIIIK